MRLNKGRSKSALESVIVARDSRHKYIFVCSFFFFFACTVCFSCNSFPTSHELIDCNNSSIFVLKMTFSPLLLNCRGTNKIRIEPDRIHRLPSLDLPAAATEEEKQCRTKTVFRGNPTKKLYETITFLAAPAFAFLWRSLRQTYYLRQKYPQLLFFSFLHYLGPLFFTATQAFLSLLSLLSLYKFYGFIPWKKVEPISYNGWGYQAGRQAPDCQIVFACKIRNPARPSPVW